MKIHALYIALLVTAVIVAPALADGPDSVHSCNVPQSVVDRLDRLEAYCREASEFDQRHTVLGMWRLGNNSNADRSGAGADVEELRAELCRLEGKILNVAAFAATSAGDTKAAAELAKSGEGSDGDAKIHDKLAEVGRRIQKEATARVEGVPYLMHDNGKPIKAPLFDDE